VKYGTHLKLLAEQTNSHLTNLIRIQEVNGMGLSQHSSYTDWNFPTSST